MTTGDDAILNQNVRVMPKNSIHILEMVFAVLLMPILLYSCDKGKVYDEYLPVPLDGWDRTDEILFEIPALAEEGDYNVSVNLRINNEFPFKVLYLRVNEEVVSSGRYYSHLVAYPVYDDAGKPLGQGVNLYQSDQIAGKHHLEKGDSVCVHIKHEMRKEIIRGVVDVGVSISRR